MSMPLLTRGHILLLTGVLISIWMRASPPRAQTLFLDYNTAAQYTANFNAWNDNGSGSNGGNYSFAESPSAGLDAAGGVRVFQNSDTTASYKSGSWSFAANGATIILSSLVKANAQTSGNKVQLGILNCNTNSFNGNSRVSFHSFRFV